MSRDTSHTTTPSPQRWPRGDGASVREESVSRARERARRAHARGLAPRGVGPRVEARGGDVRARGLGWGCGGDRSVAKGKGRPLGLDGPFRARAPRRFVPRAGGRARARRGGGRGGRVSRVPALEPRAARTAVSPARRASRTRRGEARASREAGVGPRRRRVVDDAPQGSAAERGRRRDVRQEAGAARRRGGRPRRGGRGDRRERVPREVRRPERRARRRKRRKRRKRITSFHQPSGNERVAGERARHTAGAL